MNAFLNILKYSLVVILAIVAIGIIACGCLVIIPGASIFGLSYVSYDNKSVLTQVLLTDDSYKDTSAIDINAGIFNVNVEIVDTTKITNGDTHLNLRLVRNMSGFVVGDDEDKKIRLVTATVPEGDTSIFKIRIKQPEKGWLFPTQTELTVLVAQDVLKERDLTITTTKGAVKIGKSPVYNKEEQNTTKFINLKSLNVKSDSGKVTIGCANFDKSISIIKESGDIKFEVAQTADATLGIQSGFGSVDAYSLHNVVFEKMWNSSINISNITGDFVAKDIIGGNIKLGNLSGESKITNDYADITIKNITAPMTYKANDGTLNINKAAQKVNINQKSGNIKITELGEANVLQFDHVITTEGANVNIAKLHNNVDVTTKSGNVNITGSVDVLEADPSVLLTDLITVKTNDGAVTLDNVYGCVVYKCDSGKSSISAKYAKLYGKNTYLNQSGNIDVTLPSNFPLWLKWETNKSASIKLYSCESDLKTSSAHPDVVMDGTTEIGVPVNGATGTTEEILQIATRVGAISVIRQTNN